MVRLLTLGAVLGAVLGALLPGALAGPPPAAPAPTPSMCMGYYLEGITVLEGGTARATVNGQPRILFPRVGVNPVRLRTGCYSAETIDAGYVLADGR